MGFGSFLHPWWTRNPCGLMSLVSHSGTAFGCRMLLGTLLAVYGAWDAAPTAWRITNANEYTNDYSWYVRELEVYASKDCTGERIPPSKTLGSVSTSQQKFIVDGDAETAWSTNTMGTKFAARGHYVGFRVLRADAVHGNCMRLNQGTLHGGVAGIAFDILLRTPPGPNRPHSHQAACQPDAWNPSCTEEQVNGVWFDVITHVENNARMAGQRGPNPQAADGPRLIKGPGQPGT